MLRHWNVIVHAMTVEAHVCVVDATFEVGVILAVEVSPTDFSHSQDARENHIVSLGLTIHIFRPRVALHAKHIFLLTHSHKSVGHWVVAIGFLERSAAADGNGLNLRVALISIEVHTVAGRSHNHAVVHQGSSNATIFATPAHHGCRRSQTALENFVPTDDFFALSGKIFFHALHNVALKFFFGRVFLVGSQTEFLDAFLAFRALLPACLWTFVATDVEIFAREQRHHFVNHVLQELEHVFLARAHHHILNAPNDARG